MRLHHLHREHIYHETQPADLHSNRCVRGIVCGGWSCAPTPPSSGWPRTRGSRRSGHARCRQRSRGAGTGASSAAASVGRPSIDPDGQTLFVLLAELDAETRGSRSKFAVCDATVHDCGRGCADAVWCGGRELCQGGRQVEEGQKAREEQYRRLWCQSSGRGWTHGCPAGERLLLCKPHPRQIGARSSSTCIFLPMYRAAHLHIFASLCASSCFCDA